MRQQALLFFPIAAQEDLTTCMQRCLQSKIVGAVINQLILMHRSQMLPSFTSCTIASQFLIPLSTAWICINWTNGQAHSDHCCLASAAMAGVVN